MSLPDLVPVPSELADPNLFFLVLIFGVTLVGEAGIPFPLVLSGLLIFGGVLIGQGYESYGIALMVCSVLGSLMGALTVYWSSRRLGRPMITRLWRRAGLREEWLAQAEGRVASTNLLKVGVARLMPGMTLPVTVVSGLTKLSWRRFAGAVTFSELAWVGLFTSAGFLMGRLSYDFTPWLRHVPWVAATAIGLWVGLKLATWGIRVLRSRKYVMGGSERP